MDDVLALLLIGVMTFYFLVNPNASIRLYQQRIDSNARIDPTHIRIAAVIGLIVILSAVAVLTLRR